MSYKHMLPHCIYICATSILANCCRILVTTILMWCLLLLLLQLLIIDYYYVALDFRVNNFFAVSDLYCQSVTVLHTAWYSTAMPLHINVPLPAALPQGFQNFSPVYHKSQLLLSLIWKCHIQTDCWSVAALQQRKCCWEKVSTCCSACHKQPSALVSGIETLPMLCLQNNVWLLLLICDNGRCFPFACVLSFCSLASDTRTKGPRTKCPRSKCPWIQSP